MSYNTRLQEANADLQGLIDKANALPDAGSGGSTGASCIMTVGSPTAPMMQGEAFVYFVTPEGELASADLATSGTYEMQKNTIVFSSTGTISTSGNCSHLGTTYSMGRYITGDWEITCG